LLFAQWLALGHAISHAPRHAAVASVAVASATEDHAATESGHWGHAADSAECRLVDQLLNGQAPGSDAASEAGPPLAHARGPAVARTACPGPALRAYEARGPPAA
jgi:hypothetical protein